MFHQEKEWLDSMVGQTEGMMVLPPTETTMEEDGHNVVADEESGRSLTLHPLPPRDAATTKQGKFIPGSNKKGIRRELQEYIKRNPTDPKGHLHLAHAYRESGNFYEMFDEYNIAMRLAGPTLDERYYNDPEAWSICVGEIIEFFFFDKQSFYIQPNRPLWIGSEENPDDMLEMAELAVDVSPTEPLPWRALGMVLDYQYGAYERALKCFKKFKSLAKDKGGDAKAEELANQHISVMVEVIKEKQQQEQQQKEEGDKREGKGHGYGEEKKDGDEKKQPTASTKRLPARSEGQS